MNPDALDSFPHSDGLSGTSKERRHLLGSRRSIRYIHLFLFLVSVLMYLVNEALKIQIAQMHASISALNIMHLSRRFALLVDSYTWNSWPVEKRRRHSSGKLKILK